MLADSDLLFTPLGSILPAVPLLLSQVGYAAVPGLVILAAAIPIQILSARLAYTRRTASTAMTDKRMHLTHEVLGHIAAIKLQAWSAAYVERLHGLRTTELQHLRSLKLVSATTSASFAALPVLASLATFSTYAFTRSQDVARDPGTVFLTFMRVLRRPPSADAVRLFQMIWMPLSGLQRAVVEAVDGHHACRRLDRILRVADRENSVVVDPSADLAIDVRGAVLTWTPSDATALDDKPFQLELDLQIPRGQLVAIVGAISTGKTAICRTLAGHLKLQSGSVTIGALSPRPERS